MSDATRMPMLPHYAMPQSVEAEQGLIGSVLTANKVLSQLPPVVPEDFFSDYHATIWKHMLELTDAGQQADAVTVLNRIVAGGVDDTARSLRDYLVGCVQACITLHAAEGYATQIREFAHRRRLLRSAYDLVDRIGTADLSVKTSDIVDEHLAELVGGLPEDEFEDAADVFERVRAKARARPEVDPTGLPVFDRAFAGGLHRHKFYGIGARWKQGKSFLLSTISYNLAVRQGIPHAYLCLEDTPDPAIEAMTARHMGCNRLAFIDGEGPDEYFHNDLQALRNPFAGTGLQFYSRPRMRLDTLKSAVARLAMKGKIRGVILDYFQLVGGQEGRQSTTEHQDDVAQSLAEFCKNYDLWVLAAFQLNADGNTRYGDGLMMACDLAYTMHALEIAGRENERWFEMKASRYTKGTHLGDENNGVVALNKTTGPYFEDLT